MQIDANMKNGEAGSYDLEFTTFDLNGGKLANEVTISTAPDPEPQKAEAVRSWRKLFVDFSQTTTLHGLHFVTTETPIVLRR